YLELASQTVAIGPANARASYLNAAALLDAVRSTGADGVHPGYGFLSENATFAQQVLDAGARFIGPAPRWLAAMGHKTAARDLMSKYGMPMTAGSDVLESDASLWTESARLIGYPVLVKPADGGGGIGMIRAVSDEDLSSAVERARSVALRSFGAA